MAAVVRPTRSIYAGLFCTTLATLMFEIVLTRIFSVTMWYHFAFMAISIAMFGMTVGAIVVYLRPDTFSEGRAARELARNALRWAIALVVAFLVSVRIPFLGATSPTGVACLALTYLVIAVPFVFSGVTVAVALTKFPRHVGSLYAADLVGAAAGCIALIAALELADAASAVLAIGAVAALGALCFASAADARGLRRAGAAVGVGLALLAAGHAWLVRRGRPLIQIVDSAGQRTDAYHWVRWNSHSRVSVSGNPFVLTPAAGWGLSEKTGAARAQARQLAMAIDTWAGTVITQFQGDTRPLQFLKDDVTNVAHYLRPDADVFVIGVGGGRDVLSALVFGQRSVTGVEINHNVLRALTGRFGDFSGHLERQPNVTLVADEARSYIGRAGAPYDIIQVSLIDTWAATAAGAFVLTENSLYTVEAWTRFLAHLKPDGILSVSRWYHPARPAEALRLLSLARAALVRHGVEAPRQHVVMVKAPRATGVVGRLGNGVVTILVGRDPFGDAELAALEREVDRLGFDVVVSPHAAEDEAFATILDGDDLGAFYAAYPLDISAPTDDRPFFFQMLRLRDVLHVAESDGVDPNRNNLQAIRMLAILLLIVAVLTALCIVAPLALGGPRGALRGALPHLAYFAAIGLGFMLVEISQMQRLMVFLGHPTYALSVVLFALLVGSGLGSLLAGPLTAGGVPRRRLAALGVLIAALALFGGLTPWLTRALADATTPVRVALAGGLLLVLGLFMGLPFPLGMRAAAGRSAALTPWLWGVNGAASVLCSVLAVAVALSAGIGAAFWLGVACYAGAAAADVSVARSAGRPLQP